MKDLGIYAGSCFFGYSTYLNLGDVLIFTWWQIIFIAFYVLLMTILGGIFGMAVQEYVLRVVEKIKKRWNGKKNLSKPLL